MDSDQEWREAIQMYASRVDVPDTLVAGAIAGARDLAASRRRRRFLVRATGAVAAAAALALGGGTAGYLAALSTAAANPAVPIGEVPDVRAIESTITELVPAELTLTNTDARTTSSGTTIVSGNLGERSSLVITVTIEPNGTPAPTPGVGRWTCESAACTVRGLADGAVIMVTRPADHSETNPQWGATLGRPDGAVIDVTLSTGTSSREPPFTVETLALIAFHLNW